MWSVRPATGNDSEAWLRMRMALWPIGTEAEHRAEIALFLSGRAREPQAVLLAVDESDRPFGLAELSIRPCAEGCQTNRVAYLEGWYVVPAMRRHGLGQALIEAACEWARAQGCTEMASDAQPDNEPATCAHRATGFQDAGLVRCFRRDL